MSLSRPDPHAHRYMHHLPFGAQFTGGAHTKPRTRFRLWAPSCWSVQVEFENAPGLDPLDMTDTDNGWFEGEAPCGPGTLYRYRIDGAQAVPDPASRFQPRGVSGPSEVLDPRAYAWRHAQWPGRPWEETVIYELHVGALGGYRGVAQRLPALAGLGATAVELMPLNDYPGERGWGYDSILPYAPHAAYGSPDELKALIDEAHGLGLQMFIDVVYNHFGPLGNALPLYAAPFFRAGTKTPWGDGPDFDRFEVRDFFCDNALYWLTEYRFDGLRIDAAHAIGNAPWLRELADHVHARIEPGRHVHLVLENGNNAASLLDTHFDAQWNDDLHHALHVLLTGETEGYYCAFAGHPVRQLARALAEGFAFQGEPSPAHGGEPRGEPSAHLPPTAFVAFLQNHDQVGNRAFGERLRALCGDDDALRAATALVLLAPGIPLLFMDEEHGSTQPFLFFTDYADASLAESIREGRRQEFAAFAAFADPARRAAIPDPNDPATFAASSPQALPAHVSDARRDERAGTTANANAAQDGERREWMHFYQSALAVRARLVMPRLRHARALGATVLVDARGHETAALVARWRLGDGETLSIALNLGADAVPLPGRPEPPWGTVIFETPARARDAACRDQRLPARACLVWLTGDVPGYASHHDARAIPRQEQPT
ncbi:malto-oligosyltrehalose trehalohydrolase [Burkholderia sp. WAC0059]|uniref:malto-oligosyltrehalose trehalohydrolase n=1 Tax=Burkholderia sp. WAC0059 TaxID=2066022 RepID=UPI000C7F697C|nr:malto-oligosyltrehalose trehalohydrolase [Burkholderia sp. WAC0059]PLZ01003.1 malto-oligosyltrehalose trehalohydrolase [Burkholderia sp. WAC0059]